MYHIEGRHDGRAKIRQDGVDISDQVHAVTIRLEAGKRPVIALEMASDKIEYTGPADKADKAEP